LALASINIKHINILAEELHRIWQEGKRVYICENGGSAGNSIHLAYDYHYGISKIDGIGL